MPIDNETLRHIPLFATLSSEELAQVATLTVEQHYERGDLILLEGDLGGALRTRQSVQNIDRRQRAGSPQSEGGF